MNIGTIMNLLAQANDKLPEFLSLSSKNLDDMDFTKLLNSYVEVQNLWSDLQVQVSEGLKLIGDYITDTVVCEDVPSKEERPQPVNSKARYLALLQGIKKELESLEIPSDEIRPEKEGYSFHSLGFKVISSPEINRHGDNSYSIMVIKKFPDGKNLVRIYATIADAVEFLLIRRDK